MIAALAKGLQYLQPISVVLIGVSGMVGDIVKRIFDDEPDIEVAAEFRFEPQIVPRVVDAGADVVILSTADRSLPSAVRELLREQPRAKVLTIRDDGRTTSLYELRPHETDLGQVSPETLLEAVRTARTAPL